MFVMTVMMEIMMTVMVLVVAMEVTVIDDDDGSDGEFVVTLSKFPGHNFLLS